MSTYEISSPDGKKFEVTAPDDATEEQVLSYAQQNFKTAKEEPKTNLLSVEGISSTLRRLGPDMVKGIMGDQLAGMEEYTNAIDSKRAKGETIPETQYEKEARASIASKRAAIGEATKEIDSIAPNPSYPLQIAQGITSSIAQNAPGLGIGVLARAAGPIAAVPGLKMAADQAEGSAYAEARVDKNAPIEESLVDARGAGVAEAGFEILPMGYFIKHLGKDGLFKFATKYISKELGTELPTTYAQDMTDWATVDKKMPIGEFLHKLASDLIDTAVITPFAAGGTSLAAHGIHKAGQFDPENVLGLPDAGDNNATLSPPLTAERPQWDWPTSPPATPQEAQGIAALIASVDPETLDEKQVADAKAAVADYDKKRATPVLPEAQGAWPVLSAAGQLDTGELGASPKQARNAANYINPNQGDRSERPILFGPAGTEGLTPQQHLPQAATYVLGVESPDRSLAYLKALYETYEGWRQKYAPNSTIVISNEELPFANALGWHYSEGNQHIVVPAPIRSPSKGLDEFNKNTQASAFYNASHEFGHIIVDDRFMENIDPIVQATVRREAKTGLVSDESIAQFTPERQAVLQEYNAVKREVLAGTITTKQFVDRWMGPGKAGRQNILDGVDPVGPATLLLTKIARAAVKSAGVTDVKQGVAMVKDITNDLLGLDEFLAEQTARHAYQAKWDQKTPLGQFFHGALESLRAFFIDNKRSKLIAPGIAFTQWIDGLTKTGKTTNAAEHKVNAKKAVKEVKPVEKTTVKKPRIKRTQINVETDTSDAKHEKGSLLIFSLYTTGKIKLNSPEYNQLFDLLAQKDYDEFVDLYKKISGKKIKFELEDIGYAVDERKIILVTARQMYTGKTSDLMVKELVQNSFDAVKSMLRTNKITEGNITVITKASDNSITVVDNGTGMDRDTLIKALLTYPGTSKPDLPPEESSGGLGQAKQLLLFTPDRIHIETIKNGVKLILDASPEQLLDKTAKLQTEQTDQPNGTTFTAFMPRKITVGNKQEDVKLPVDAYSYGLHSNPPLYPNVTLTFEFPEGEWNKKVVVENPLLSHKLFQHLNFDWGSIDIYLGPLHEAKYAYSARHRVMSAGVYQFNFEVKGHDGKIPQDIIFDIKSKVRGQEPGYPFTMERQSLKEHAATPLLKALREVIKKHVMQMIAEHVQAYANVIDLETGQKPGYTISEASPGIAQITFVRGVQTPALHYNSTNKDIMAIPGAHAYMKELAGLFREYIEHYTKVHEPKGVNYSPGIGFSRGYEVTSRHNNGWAGLHFRIPYHAVWINPVYDMKNLQPQQIAAGLLETMVHETVHVNVGDHDAAFAWEYHRTVSNIYAGPKMQQLKDKLQSIIATHFPTHLKLFEVFNATDTSDVTDSIKGNTSSRIGSATSIGDATDAYVAGTELDRSQPNPVGAFRNVSYELDLSDDPAGGKFLKGIRNFMNDPAPLRRSLRRIQGMGYWGLQVQQLSHLFPDIQNLAIFNYFNTQYNSRKSALQAQPDRLSDEGSRLGDEEFRKVGKVFFDEAQGKELWFDLKKTTKLVGQSTRIWWEYAANVRTYEELKARGIDMTTEEGEQTAKLILDIKNDLLDKINEKELVMQDLLSHRYGAAGPQVLENAIKVLSNSFHEIRKQPFFPQGRFGNLMLIIERKRDGERGYEVVHREAFENRADWEEAHKRAFNRKLPDERVTAKELTDQQYVLMALPTEFLDIAASELDLSSEQVEQLTEIMQPVRVEKALKPYDLARLGVSGFSKDWLRTYANFSWHDSNLIAKMEYRSKFGLAIRGVGTDLRKFQMAGPAAERDAFRYREAKRAMERARDYIMSPPNEAQQLRALVSIGYLGLNPKTALFNLFGLMTTWSDNTERLGILPGTLAMAKATKQMFQTVKLTDLNTRRAGDYLPPESQKALDLALEQGVLSQSYAYHLAGRASSNRMFREVNGPVGTAVQKGVNAGKRIGKGAIDAAMYPFRLTELSTRRVTFLAAFAHANSTPGISFQDAYDEAVTRTNKLQNDYSLGNRVPFMRGMTITNHPLGKIIAPIIPLATVFWSFAQHMGFHGYGLYELGERRAMRERGETPRKVGTYTAKLWLIILLAAGYEGLPGAENILDLLEAAWRKWGGDKPIRQELREFIQSIEGVTLDPQTFAHGFGHNFLGFDVSRSLGVGRFIPGTDVLAHPRENLDSTVGTLTLDMLGATGAFLRFGLDAVFSSKGPAETFQHLPGGLGNIYTSYYWSQHGVRAPNAGLITHDLETGKLRDLTTAEIFGRALGFNPAIVSQNRELRFTENDRKIYWQSKRTNLLDDVWEAHWKKDKEGEVAARKEITEFNARVPGTYKDLRIQGADVARSIRGREKNKALEEKQQPSQKRFRGLYEDIQKSYDPE